MEGLEFPNDAPIIMDVPELVGKCVHCRAFGPYESPCYAWSCKQACASTGVEAYFVDEPSWTVISEHYHYLDWYQGTCPNCHRVGKWYSVCHHCSGPMFGGDRVYFSSTPLRVGNYINSDLSHLFPSPMVWPHLRGQNAWDARVAADPDVVSPEGGSLWHVGGYIPRIRTKPSRKDPMGAYIEMEDRQRRRRELARSIQE